MLQALHIRDLALVEHAELRLAAGLNVLSGETGGGKSLVVTALKLLRGEKAAAGLVRHGASELRVDGEFLLGSSERSQAVAELLRAGGAEAALDEPLLVSRIVDPQGRSKVRIQGRPAPLAALRDLGAYLLEIHGQGDTHASMRPEMQAEILDGFAGTRALRAQFASALMQARALHDRLRLAASNERERLARVEFLRYQIGQMAALRLTPGELGQLEQEHRVLANLDRLREQLGIVVGTLQDAEPSANELLARATKAMLDAAEIDGALAAGAEALREAQAQINDAARAAQSALARFDLDPSQLAAIEARLEAVRRALARFGPTEAEFVAHLDRAQAELAQFEDQNQAPAMLEQQLRTELAGLAEVGRQLERARSKAAPAFSAAVQRELHDLAMDKAVFRVMLQESCDAATVLAQATIHGPSPVDFEARINPGEPFCSLRETASGGERSRLVIAIKKCLADHDRVPFLVFDEVDAEIGGRLGLAVGRKLAEIAKHHQVLIVTHLPQVAAFGQAHFKVEKTEREGRTRSTIRCLDGRSVEQELAAMTVGEGADADAIAQARQLVARARREESAAG